MQTRQLGNSDLHLTLLGIWDENRQIGKSLKGSIDSNYPKKTKLAKPIHRRDTEQAENSQREEKKLSKRRGEKERKKQLRTLSLLLSANSLLALCLCGEWAYTSNPSMITARTIT
jgi:hypothetical protein